MKALGIVHTLSAPWSLLSQLRFLSCLSSDLPPVNSQANSPFWCSWSENWGCRATLEVIQAHSRMWSTRSCSADKAPSISGAVSSKAAHRQEKSLSSFLHPNLSPVVMGVNCSFQIQTAASTAGRICSAKPLRKCWGREDLEEQTGQHRESPRGLWTMGLFPGSALPTSLAAPHHQHPLLVSVEQDSGQVDTGLVQHSHTQGSVIDAVKWVVSQHNRLLN